MIKLGADPNKIPSEDKSNFDPWRPYYPNPHDSWGKLVGKKGQMNLVTMVSCFDIHLIDIGNMY